MAAVVLFVDAWLTGAKAPRAMRVAWTIAALAWLTLISGGFWYLYGYPPVKAAIKAGPAPWAHSVVMETKEHLFFLLLLVATMLPFALRDLKKGLPDGVRGAAMTLAGLLIILGLAMEGMGGLISLAARMALEK